MTLISRFFFLQGARYKLTYDGMYHLDIPKTRQYDHGKVEVIARSSVGETRYETTLTVKPRSDDYRGVLKNSPRRKYRSPWGPGRWNRYNLVHPPEFFEFSADSPELVLTNEQFDVKEWLKTRKYLNFLLPNTDDATSQKKKNSRNDSTLYKSYLTLAQVEHKSMNTPNFTEISLKNSSIQHKFSMRHIQGISEHVKQSDYNYSAPVPHKRDSHTTKLSNIIPDKPCTCPKSHNIPVVASKAAYHDDPAIEIHEIYEHKKLLQINQCNEALRFTHTARKDLLHVWNARKIIQ